jgi:uncharacterized protein YjbI with pentapeptide repeats
MMEQDFDDNKTRWPRWTGLGGKTLWDWIGLLIVPLMLGVGGLWFTEEQKQREEEARNERSQDEALQSYLDQMSQLLIDTEGTRLRKLEPDEDVRNLMRARTITALAMLDASRKARVVRYLVEADLITRENPVIDLRDTDLRGVDLKGIDLNHRNLSGVYLTEANLSEANLRDVNLSGATLTDATLSDATITDTNLTDADLSGADLTYAELSNTALSGADLSGADLRDAQGLTQAQIEQAIGDQTTQLPIGLQPPAAWSRPVEEQRNMKEQR